MKFEAMKSGCVVLNKVNGYAYKLTATENGFRAVRVLTDEEREQGMLEDVIENVGKQNAVCFCLIENPNWVKFEVENGKFYADGAAVLLGQIKPIKVLAAGKDSCLLAVEKQESLEGYFDIMRYSVAQDFFKTVVKTVQRADVLKEINDYTILAYDACEKAKITRKDDEIEEVNTLVNAGLLVFNKVSGDVTTGYNLPVDEICFAEENENGFDIFAKVSGTVERISVQAEDKVEYEHGGLAPQYDEYDENDEYDEDDEDAPATKSIGVIKPLEERVRIIKLRYRYGDLNVVSENTLDGELEIITTAGKNRVIKTSKVIYITNGKLICEPEAVEALKGYDHLVKDANEHGVDVYSFCNNDYEVKTVTITRLTDRGTIVEVM